MGCILTDPNSDLNALYQLSRESGTKLAPILSMRCNDCGTHHTIEVPEDMANLSPSVEVKPEDFKPIAWKNKTYCSDCASYHELGDCKNPGRAEKLGANVGRGYDNWNG